MRGNINSKIKIKKNKEFLTSKSINHKFILSLFSNTIFFIIINVGVRANLYVPQLISHASSSPEICETRTGDL